MTWPRSWRWPPPCFAAPTGTPGSPSGADKQPQPALARLGIRFNKRQARHVPPAYHTIRNTIRSVDAEALDRVVSGWAWAQVRTGAIDGAKLRRLALTLAFAPTLDMLDTRHDDTDDDNTPDAEPPGADTTHGPSDDDGPCEPHQRQAPPLDATITADAMHTQRKHATYIRRRGGDYVLIAKENQPTMLDRVKAQPWWDQPVAYEQDNNGHGRYERRAIRVLPAPEDLDFPDARQVFVLERTVVNTVKRTKRNGRTKTKKKTSYVPAYGVTSLTAEQASPADLATSSATTGRSRHTTTSATPHSRRTPRRSAPATAPECRPPYGTSSSIYSDVFSSTTWLRPGAKWRETTHASSSTCSEYDENRVSTS